MRGRHAQLARQFGRDDGIDVAQEVGKEIACGEGKENTQPEIHVSLSVGLLRSHSTRCFSLSVHCASSPLACASRPSASIDGRGARITRQNSASDTCLLYTSPSPRD